MANRIIQIHLNGTTLSYTNGAQSADQFHIKPRNKLSWRCGDGDYSILFKEIRSPFTSGERAFAAHTGETTTGKVIKDVAPGDDDTFSYAVTVIGSVSGQAVTDDPDVIIDDPGGGGHSSGPKRTGSAAKKKKQGTKKKK